MSQNVKIGLFIAVSVITTTFSFYFWQVFRTPNINLKGEKSFALLIPKGTTFTGVLDSLKTHNMLNDEQSFRFLSRLMKYNENVKMGRYELKPDMGNYETIKKLRSGSQDPLTITFNSIRLRQDLAQKVGAKFAFGPDSLGKYLDDPAVCREYGFDTTTIVCLFIPNSYEMFWTIKPKALIDRMAAEYKKFWTPDRQQKAKALNMSQSEVQTLASIVQGETNKTDEQPRVAGVYLNRLERGIKLEADPTVIFALRDFGIRRLLTRQLAVDSPYNTYRNRGLPPGPINLPSITAIDAVLNAEKHDYLFFVVDARFNGYHTFSKTLSEHMANAHLYQRALTERKIMK